MSTDILIDHALKSAWCAPNQDLQVRLKPQRLTEARGVYHQAPHLWSAVPLPTPQDTYHVYQIGAVHPTILGLLNKQRVWTSLATMMSLEDLHIDLYTNDGLQLLRAEAWLLVTEERNVILAVREQSKITDLRTEPVYLRLYSNAFFGSVRASGFEHRIECKGHRVTTTERALLFQRDYHNSRDLTRGFTQCFVNGRSVHDFIPQNLSAGDLVEFVYDSTIKRVIDLPIRDLLSFDSVLDSKRKYLLTYSGTQVGGESIDYRDDIDVYLLNKGTRNNRPIWDGVFYHKNKDDALRMVTHRDYAIAIPYMAAYLQKNNWADITALTVRLVIREAGYLRPLVHEHHRIKELYKLPFADRRRAMLGIDSNVRVWRASELENSAYTKLMDATYSQVTNLLVQDAYGYNAIGKLVGDGPIEVRVVNGRRQVNLPAGLFSNATMYEYNAQGHLLGYHYHARGAEYVPQSSQCVIVEGLVGRGSYRLSAVFGQRDTALDPIHNYRFYVAPINQGRVQHDKWRDVTGDDSQYMIANNVATWLINRANFAVAVKSDRDFLTYDLTLRANNGLLKFSIDSSATYPSGSAQGVMYIPVGKLDLWLNDRALIEGLDYTVQWPEIVIVNKAFLVEGQDQKVTVRGAGFCLPTMVREAPAEVGFVEHGLLSRNRRFNLRDDKVLRIVVEGATHHRRDLLFTEDDSGVRMENVRNGAPYVIEEPVIPMRGITTENTYKLRTKSKTVDQQVSDYLTLKRPQPPIPEQDLIPDKYPVYSPFSSTVMHDLLNGVLSMDGFKGQYSDKKVKDFLTDYAYLLAYDPTQKDLDLYHVHIHPHNLNTEVELDIFQYNFLNRAIRVLLDDRVDITRFVSIKPTL